MKVGTVANFLGFKVVGKQGEHMAVNVCDAEGGSLELMVFGGGEKNKELMELVRSLPRFCQVRFSVELKKKGDNYDIFLTSFKRVDDKGKDM